MPDPICRASAIFAASLTAHANGVRWDHLTGNVLYMEELVTRTALLLSENVTPEEATAISVITYSDAEAVLFYLDQFEAVGA